jgi:hypothetical protein
MAALRSALSTLNPKPSTPPPPCYDPLTMNLLVTGGNGGVGRAVVSTLIAEGHRVRILDRTVADKPVAGVDYVTGELADYATVRRALDGVDAVIHLAALTYPAAAPAHVIYAVNASGTFNVYSAAADAGVKRVVAASSINALGYNFGVRDFAIRYFPLDEAHPSFTTDAYSFSKEAVESIGAYFWRRDGISGAQLRLPWVYSAAPEYAQVLTAETGEPDAFCAAFLALSPADQLALIDKARTWRNDARRARAFESLDQFPLPPNDGSPNAKLITMLAYTYTDFWTAISANDAANAFVLAATSPYDGSHPVFVCEAENTLGLPSRMLAEAFFPDAQLRDGLEADATLVSYERAARLFGFAPTLTMRSWLKTQVQA